MTTHPPDGIPIVFLSTGSTKLKLFGSFLGFKYLILTNFKEVKAMKMKWMVLQRYDADILEKQLHRCVVW